MVAEERYQNDPIYRSLVFTMRKLIWDGSLTGNHIVEAAELARKFSKEAASRPNDKWNDRLF